MGFDLQKAALLNTLLDVFTGNRTTAKWGKTSKCSQDTALRNIQDLPKKGILEIEANGGRSTNCKLVNKPSNNIVLQIIAA